MPQAPDSARPPALTIVDHPLVQHKLSLMRKRETSTSKFRALLREVSLLLAYEATRNLALEQTDIETPLEAARMPVLAGKKVCLVSIITIHMILFCVSRSTVQTGAVARVYCLDHSMLRCLGHLSRIPWWSCRPSSFHIALPRLCGRYLLLPMPLSI